MESEVEVLCDGKKLSLVPFVEVLIANTVGALVRSLKGAEGAREIRITLSPKPR